MCIAILKKKKGIITDEALKESFKRNPDGAGIAYTKDNKLYIVKGIFKVDDLIKKVREIEKICDNNMLIHCRIGTSGKKDARNTHPFLVSENLALIHNGILDVDIPKKSKMNDTYHYIEKFLKGIPEDMIIHNEYIVRLIKDSIGKRNKFVFLNNKGEFRIINSKEGHWKQGVWYSNNSYVKQEPVYFTGWCNNRSDDSFYGKQVSLWNQRFQPTTDFKRFGETRIVDAEPTPVNKLTKDEEEDLVNFITGLTTEDYAILDDYPVYDRINHILLPVEQAEDTDFEFLEDVSEEMYEFYMDMKEDKEDELFEDNFDDAIAEGF